MNRRIQPRASATRVTTLVRALAGALVLGGAGAAAADPSGPRPLPAGVLDVLDRFATARPDAMTSRERVLDLATRVLIGAERNLDGAVLVTNCDDDGPGSLRNAIVSVAGDGDTIDLTTAGCSTITLTTGAIVATQDNLTLQGVASSEPGFPETTISGASAFIPIVHVGTGALNLYDVAIENGLRSLPSSAAFDARGGCIYSLGSVALSDARIADCRVNTLNASYRSYGGGIYAQGDVVLIDSRVESSYAGSYASDGRGAGISARGSVFLSSSTVAFNDAAGNSIGGGVLTGAGLTAKYSTLVGNQAYVAGGAIAIGDNAIERSTVKYNNAGRAGGLFLSNGASTYPTTIRNATVTYNSAGGSVIIICPRPRSVSGGTYGIVGGIALFGTSARIVNSTIADNLEYNCYDAHVGAGIYIGPGVALDLESSIVAPNWFASHPRQHDDVGGASGSSLSGATNIIQAVLPPLAAPAGTIATDPLLFGEHDNGGPTVTRAPMAGSPAIDAGSDVDTSEYDQRGAGFARVVGSAADIGAFERQSPLDGDRIFTDGFD
jgi:hypothetical protein